MKKSIHRKSTRSKNELNKKLVFALQPPGRKKIFLSIPLNFPTNLPVLTSAKQPSATTGKKQVLFQVTLESM